MRLLESQRRSILKAISYRFVGAGLGAMLALMLTRQLSVALTFGLLDIVIKIGGYYLHERIWDRIHYGRVHSSDYEI